MGERYTKQILEIAERQNNKGLNKYGKYLEDFTSEGIIKRLEHLEEEIFDALNYIQWIKDKIKNGGVISE